MTDLNLSVLQPISKQSLRHGLVQRLILAIFRREFDRAQRLVEEELAAQFAVSRTPVREALTELAGLGMIEMRPGRGALLRDFGKDQLADLYQVRGILETEATRFACGKIDRQQLQTIEGRLRTLHASRRRDAVWSRKAIEADKELHDAIAVCCGNARLAHEITRYLQLVQAVREAIGNDYPAQARAVEEHLEIVSYLIDHNANAAAAAMSQHVAGAAKAAIETMFPQRSPASVSLARASLTRERTSAV